MKDLKEIITTLRNGKIVLLPTECGWGFAVSINFASHLGQLQNQITQLKTSELVVLIEGSEMLNEFVIDVPEMAFTLLEISEKPLTLSFDKCKNDSLSLIFSELLSFRMPQHDLTVEIIKGLKTSLLFLPISYNKYEEIPSQLLDLAEATVDLKRHNSSDNHLPGIIHFDKKGALKVIRE